MTTISSVVFLFVGCHLILHITGQRSGCQLPNEPPNRRFCPVECLRCYGGGGSCYFPPGTSVTQSVIRVQCAPGYRLDNDQDSTLIACTNGAWSDDFPQCLAQCPPLESDSVFVRCQFGTREVDCTRPMMPQTQATFQCRKPSHTEYPNLVDAGVYRRTLTCRYDGKWSYSLPECKPVCGVSKGSAIVEQTVVDGVDTPLGVFPWHAGIYQREEQGWKYICGGSLITKHVVLTAAHCVITDQNDLQVTFAKLRRPWNQDEPDTVKRSVSAITIPREYSSGANTLAWDIALLLLSQPVQITTNIMPVCRDVNLNFDIARDTKGYVVGWGQTAPGKVTDILQHNDLTIRSYDDCLKQIPRLLAVDKFCGTNGPVSVVEKGDSGGGLTVVFNHQHYILGIVSVKYNNISVFTNVSWFPHRHWMDTEMNNFYQDISRCPLPRFQCGSFGPCLDRSIRCDGRQDCPDGSDEHACPSTGNQPGRRPDPPPAKQCRLPSQPRHGSYESTLCSSSERNAACRNTPGANVPNNWLLKYKCEDGYVLNSTEYDYSACDKGYWKNPLSCIAMGNKRPGSGGHSAENSGGRGEEDCQVMCRRVRKDFYLQYLFTANWYKAQQYCLLHGMRLATVSNKEEQAELERQMKENGLLQMWIGGTNHADKDQWFWMSTGVPVSYTKWAPSEPNNIENDRCIEIKRRDWQQAPTEYGWTDAGCNFGMPFACELISYV